MRQRAATAVEPVVTPVTARVRAGACPPRNAENPRMTGGFRCC